MCMHWHVRTLSWLYPAEFNQRNRVRSAQRNLVHSSTPYVQRGIIGYIHQSYTFSAVQLSTFFTAQLSTFHRFYRTNNMDRLTSTIPHRIPPFKRVAIENLLFAKLLVFSPMLSSSKYVVGVKAAAPLVVASVSEQMPNTNFIAMAEMVVRST